MKLKQLILVGIGAVCLAVPAFAQANELSRINVTVPFSEGGGSDTLVRVMQPFLQKQLPGNPVILIRNEPGGAGLPATNRFVQSAERDGSSLISLSSSIFVANALGNPQIQFKLNDFIPVFIAPLGPVIYVSPSTGATGPGDVAGIGDTELVFGGGRQDSADMLTVMQLDLLGLKVRSVWGLDRGGGRIGFERGEFNVDHQTSVAFNASVLPMVEAGRAVPLMTSGIVTPEGTIARDPLFPDIPTFTELYEKVHGKPLSGPAFEAYMALTTAAITTGKTVALPQGTPRDVVESYAAAMKAVVENPDFLSATEASLGGYPLYTGADAQRVFSAGGVMSAEAYAWLKEWCQTKLNYKIAR